MQKIKIGSSPLSIQKYIPLDPDSHLHILCKYTIQVYSIKDLLGPGGGGTYFKIKNGDEPIFEIYDQK